MVNTPGVKLTMTSFAEEFSATHHQLSDVRRRVGAWMRGQGHDDAPILVGDVEMVITELAANVVDHTGSPWIRVAVELPGDRVTIEVSHQGSAHGVPAVEEWGELLEGTRGRGLRIVRALCNTIVVTGDVNRTHVRCDVPLSAAEQAL